MYLLARLVIASRPEWSETRDSIKSISTFPRIEDFYPWPNRAALKCDILGKFDEVELRECCGGGYSCWCMVIALITRSWEPTDRPREYWLEATEQVVFVYNARERRLADERRSEVSQQQTNCCKHTKTAYCFWCCFCKKITRRHDTTLKLLWFEDGYWIIVIESNIYKLLVNDFQTHLAGP